MRERISKALHKRWERYHYGPEKFCLNIDHWMQLGYSWKRQGNSPVADAFLYGSHTVLSYMGIKMILMRRGKGLNNKYGSRNNLSLRKD